MLAWRNMGKYSRDCAHWIPMVGDGASLSGGSMKTESKKRKALL